MAKPTTKSTTADKDKSANTGGSTAGGDGATMTPAVGTSTERANELSTKEGAAPLGVEEDQGTTSGADAGPVSPNGVFVARATAQDVQDRVYSVIREFANIAEEEDDDAGNYRAISATSNLHDDLGIQRAHIVHFAAKLEQEFGVDITPSEAQNFLLVRDVQNVLLRKLAAKA